MMWDKTVRKVTRREIAESILRAHCIQIQGDMVLWSIPYIYLIKELHLRMPEACLNSQAFTLANGFRFRLKLMLNQRESGNVSLYVQMLPSKIHQKSFRGVITMLLIDQGETKQHVTKSIKALDTKPSFQASDSENVPNGVRKLLESDQMFCTPPVLYVKNNTCVFGVCLRENLLVK